MLSSPTVLPVRIKRNERNFSRSIASTMFRSAVSIVDCSSPKGWWCLENRCSCCQTYEYRPYGPTKFSSTMVQKSTSSSSSYRYGHLRRRRQKLSRLLDDIDVPECEYAHASQMWRSMNGGSDILYPLRVRVLGDDVIIKTSFRLHGLVYGPFAKAVHRLRHEPYDFGTRLDIWLLFRRRTTYTISESQIGIANVPIVDWLGPCRAEATFRCEYMNIDEYRNVLELKRRRRIQRLLDRARDPHAWFDIEPRGLFERWLFDSEWIFGDIFDTGRRLVIFVDHNRKKPGRGQRGRRQRYRRRKREAAAATARPIKEYDASNWTEYLEQREERRALANSHNVLDEPQWMFSFEQWCDVVTPDHDVVRPTPPKNKFDITEAIFGISKMRDVSPVQIEARIEKLDFL